MKKDQIHKPCFARNKLFDPGPVAEMASEVAAKLVDNMKVKAEEGEEEEDEEDLVDPAAEIKEKCGEGQCNLAKVTKSQTKTA